MNTTKAATCRAAATTHWHLAATHRQIGNTSKSYYHAALAQTYHATAAAAECEPDPVPAPRSWWQRLLGVGA